MKTKISNVIFGIIVANMLIIAVVGYTVQKQVPDGVIILTKGGVVKFNHVHHIQHGTSRLECVDCHHQIKNEQTGAAADPEYAKCRDCHYYGKFSGRFGAKSNVPAGSPQGNEKILKSPCNPKCEEEEIHVRCIGKNCVSCHQNEECNFCHYQSW